MIKISDDKLLYIAAYLNDQMYIHEDAIQILKQLIQPWIHLIDPISSVSEIHAKIIQRLSPELSEIFNEELKRILQNIELKTHDLENQMGIIKTAFIEYMIGIILESAFELAQNKHIFDIDSYFIYAGIADKPELYLLFEKQIPVFNYIDSFSVQNYLSENYPHIKFTSGFCQSLETHIDLIIGSLSSSNSIDSSKIDSIAKRYGPIQTSLKRTDATLQLKQNMVKYMVEHSNSQKLSFSDIINILKIK